MSTIKSTVKEQIADYVHSTEDGLIELREYLFYLEQSLQENRVKLEKLIENIHQKLAEYGIQLTETNSNTAVIQYEYLDSQLLTIDRRTLKVTANDELTEYLQLEFGLAIKDLMPKSKADDKPENLAENPITTGLNWKRKLEALIPKSWQIAEIDLNLKQAKVYFTKEYYVWIFGGKKTRVYYFEKELDFDFLELAINWLLETIEDAAA